MVITPTIVLVVSICYTLPETKLFPWNSMLGRWTYFLLGWQLKRPIFQFFCSLPGKKIAPTPPPPPSIIQPTTHQAEVQDLAKRVPPEAEKKGHRPHVTYALAPGPVGPSSPASASGSGPGHRMQGQRSLPVLGGGGHGGMRRMQSLPQLVKSGRGPNLPRRAWDLENTTGSPTKKKGV